MELIYRQADLSDIPLLVRTRIQVLRAVNRLEETVDLFAVAQQSQDYYSRALRGGSCISGF